MNDLAAASTVKSGTARALGAAGVAALAAVGATTASMLKRMNHIPRHSPDDLREVRRERASALFDAFPALVDRIPWRPLGTFPTPIQELDPLPEAPAVRLFVKRDDLCSELYGGNKVRKLEHFLADAELRGCRTLVTLGGVGSNHALATAIHGRALGFEVDLALYDQPTTPAVRKNLGGFLAAGARLHDARSLARAFLTARTLYRERERDGAAPYFIMVGGTSRLGCLGHVSAGLELARQVREGTMPEPDLLFVPLGTCGTAIGLIVGLKLGGLRTRVAAIRVVDPFPANRTVVRFLAQDVADFLHRCAPAVPKLRLRNDDFEVIGHHFGEGYGVPTAAGERAVRWAAPQLSLDTTYSAKALAACLEHCAQCSATATVLFWNTFNSAPVATPQRWSALPPELHRIFTA